VTLQCKLEVKDLERLRAGRNPATQFLTSLIELWQDGKESRTPILHDPLAVAAVFSRDLLRTEYGSVEVETSSPLTYGMTLFKAGVPLKAPVQIATSVSVRTFLDLLTTRLAAPPLPSRPR
jgi:inosine-uridine nucleoside N-ribohydrolase